MSITASIRRNVNEALIFGPFFVLRHVGKILRLPTMALKTGNVGTIYVRPANTDAGSFNQVFMDRDYDLSKFPQAERIQATYERILASGKVPVIVDAGANAGASLRWFAKAFPKAAIVAIEPDPDTAAICRKNAQHLPNAKVVQAAVGAAAGAVDLEISPGESWANRTVRSDDGAVPVVTIPQAVVMAGEKAEPFIIKIDIEGFESDLFSENLDWIATAPVVMIEPHDWLFPGQKTSKAFMKAFANTDHEMLLSGDTIIFAL